MHSYGLFFISYGNRFNDAEMRLLKGRSYLLEVIWQQKNGKYHMTVGVQLPDEKVMRPVSDEWLIKYEPGTRTHSSVCCNYSLRHRRN